ncbi:MAG: F0F1 ATP synthase subunit delta [Intrasporangium sp.]|uniref:F0F1 ATP synthase subunit delta n=1 Tax=Intrasporangium sp. TaxID=1925024 RepID=UPI00264A05BE|nr:F0F1 ATP synthase subunit delta [Intrasporangium sp.]MDN5796155.1 F0F1 ATP synthase subunit delta [Intrasporangium sp.]
MQGSSRAAATASRDAFRDALVAGATPGLLGDELFAVLATLDSSSTLRRALADSSREAAEKQALAERLFTGKVSDATVRVLSVVSGERWSTERDLTDTIEALAVESVIATAEAGDRADRVEDELFRFERLVAADSGLHAALATQTAPTDSRVGLVDDLLSGKVAEQTLTLARQAVSHPRGRRFDRTIETYLDLAARRREQQTATVTSALPLSDRERDRLAAGLATIYGGKVHVNTVVDPRVMGGIKVEIGDELIDGTVLRKLEGARRAMGA